MTFILHRTSFAAFRCIYRTPARRKVLRLIPSNRDFYSTPISRARRNDDGNRKQDSTDPPQDAERRPFIFQVEDLSSDELAAYKSLAPDEQAIWRNEAAEYHEYMNSSEYTSEMNAQVSLAANKLLDEMPFMPPPPKIRPDKLGFLAESEEDAEDIGEDPEFEGDDITSLAHGELEQHREMREYARIAVWEMPLLHKLAQPFEPPSLERPLRFRMTTYLGESHPAAKKVSVEFCTRDIAAAVELTEAQRVKLIKLVGVRYNPDTDIVKMSCEMHETPTQNKRYLSDLVSTLIKEAKDSKDMFEDVPLDFRHHKPKKQWVFPEEWKLDAAKRQQLLAKRQKVKQIEESRQEMGQVIEGKEVLEQALKAMPRESQRVIVPEAGKRRLPRLA